MDILIQKEINPCFLSSYVPRKCGLATFTHNLFTSYHKFFPSTAAKVVAVDDDTESVFPPEVDFVFSKNKLTDYIRAAEHINSMDVQVVNLQHEFGLFGGPEGRHIRMLLEKLKKPVVTTVHTVLQQPSLGYYTSLNEIIQHSQRMVVLSNKAVEILREVYYVPREKIVMIPHGVPDLPFVKPDAFKKQIGAEDRFVLLTFGLLSQGKGIEAALEALPAVVGRHPDVLYIILGRTHPEVVKVQGERYRDKLHKIVSDNNLENNVLFINEYLNYEELYTYINACDIYITPYTSPEQISSGTLAYAVGLGKVVVSSPYWYAQELLADGRGCLVPFNDPKAMSDALNMLLDERERLHPMRLAAYQYGREMVWSRVAERYHALFREVCKEHSLKLLSRVSAIRKTKLNVLDRCNSLGMFERLTDETGLIQHAVYGIPDYKYGYSADDAGRALALVLRLAEFEEDPRYYRLAKRYLAFLNYVQKEDGLFHNFVSYDRRYLDEVGSHDTYGRVLLGLGGALAWSSDRAVTLLAKEMFDRAIAGRSKDRPLSKHPKALAYAMCGLHDYLKKYQEAAKVASLLRTGADYLVDLYLAKRDGDWEWFENVVTYGNAKVPFALLLAYNVFRDKSYLDTALAALKFLTRLQHNGEYFDIIGNQDWLARGSSRARFDQQPIEIGYLVEAFCEAQRITREKEYRELAFKAFGWFFGNNYLKVPVYNSEGDYPLDGLTATGANDNSGAESVISFALAVICLKEISIRKTLVHRTVSEKMF